MVCYEDEVEDVDDAVPIHVAFGLVSAEGLGDCLNRGFSLIKGFRGFAIRIFYRLHYSFS